VTVPDISFVVPFRNEGAFLRATCDSLANQDIGTFSAEILLVDGDSNDSSRAIAEEYLSSRHTGIVFRLFDNPRRRTPFGFNLGIAEAKGTYIGFGGAHTVYPPKYLKTAVMLLQSGDADVVGGGASRFIPSREGALARAMASLYQSTMGAGVAAYWRKRTPGYVDTVFGGFYRREVFAKVGRFDTRLARNQDNELNSRVTAAGFKILFHPSLSSEYVLKTEPYGFFARAFRFGFYHPQTWVINPRSFKLRHAVPAVFTIYVVALLLFRGAAPAWAFAPMVAYFLLLVFAALQVARLSSALSGALTVPVFFLFHLAYGAGILVGAGKSLLDKLRLPTNTGRASN
jgi:Glycosyltransferases, probably involved in cell wall biogenesis